MFQSLLGGKTPIAASIRACHVVASLRRRMHPRFLSLASRFSANVSWWLLVREAEGDRREPHRHRHDRVVSVSRHAPRRASPLGGTGPGAAGHRDPVPVDEPGVVPGRVEDSPSTIRQN